MNKIIMWKKKISSFLRLRMEQTWSPSRSQTFWEYSAFRHESAYLLLWLKTQAFSLQYHQFLAKISCLSLSWSNFRICFFILLNQKIFCANFNESFLQDGTPRMSQILWSFLPTVWCHFLVYHVWHDWDAFTLTITV